MNEVLSEDRPSHKPLLIVVSGPAGSGKTTLCERAVRSFPEEFVRVVTVTTRFPRPGEVNGVHYHFKTPEEFDALVATGAFLEWAYVHTKLPDPYRRYGTLTQSVLASLRQGKCVILCIEVQGARSVMEASQRITELRSSIMTVFVRAPISVLAARMRARGDCSEAEIDRRCQTAVIELAEAQKYDFRLDSTDRDGDFAKLCEIIEVARFQRQLSAARR